MPRIESFASEMYLRDMKRRLRKARTENNRHEINHCEKCLNVYWEHRLKRLDKKLGIR